jgi:hypothetical protein
MPWESIVMMHLTTKEKLLVCPQYNIPWDEQTRTGGSCPDFVAIHPNKPGRVYVIEVSAKSNLEGLNDKFLKRKQNWYDPLNRTLSVWGQGGPFDFKSVAFIRNDSDHFTCSGDDVVRQYLEDITFSWDPKRQSPSLP